MFGTTQTELYPIRHSYSPAYPIRARSHFVSALGSGVGNDVRRVITQDGIGATRVCPSAVNALFSDEGRS